MYSMLSTLKKVINTPVMTNTLTISSVVTVSKKTNF